MLSEDENLSLIQAEINALLGVDMGSGRDIVLTIYGHDDAVDKIAVSLFDSGSNSRTYCEMINALKTGKNPWVYAKVVPENTPFNPNMFLPNRYAFSDLMLKMDNRTIQRVFSKIESQELAMALKGATDAVLKKVFKNMSKRGAAMFKEAMEYMGPVRLNDVEEKQEKIVDIIRHLEDTGEIIIDRAEEGKYVV
jgi:flagellar motor switch protein FliG